MLKKRDQQGVTFFELLVVLTIVIILTVLALPSFLTFFQQYRVTATAQDLLYNLQYARTEAIKRDANIYVTFSTASPWCYGINVGATCNCATAGSCTLGSYSDPRTQDMTLSVAGLTGGTQLIFEGTRGATTNGATLLTLTVYGQSTAMSVEITALGNMQMCSSNISGYPVCTIA